MSNLGAGRMEQKMIQRYSQLHSMSLKEIQGYSKRLKLKIESDYQ